MRKFAYFLLSLVWIVSLDGQTPEVSQLPLDPYQDPGPVADADPVQASGHSWLRDLLSTNLNDGQTADFMARTLFELIHTGDITWPKDKYPSPQSPMVIGVLGDNHDPVIQSVMVKLKQQVIGKTVQDGRSVVIKEYTDPEKAREANILWISEFEGNHLPQIISHLQGSKVISISNLDGFVSKGGIIELKLRKSNSGLHMQFNVINDHKAQEEGVHITADVLNLTNSVL